ncbi:hypothetical protein CIG19_14680 [Enterobacterales bacterium CwR94]|nr:hypothetical protein CIG19_14680 [Enterobacterales bacterium CwR94]
MASKRITGASHPFQADALSPPGFADKQAQRFAALFQSQSMDSAPALLTDESLSDLHALTFSTGTQHVLRLLNGPLAGLTIHLHAEPHQLLFLLEASDEPQHQLIHQRQQQLTRELAATFVRPVTVRCLHAAP